MPPQITKAEAAQVQGAFRWGDKKLNKSLFSLLYKGHKTWNSLSQAKMFIWGINDIIVRQDGGGGRN